MMRQPPCTVERASAKPATKMRAMSPASRSKSISPARETPLLHEGKQLFLAAHVVVHAGERHPARRREVPHRGGVVALLGEHLRRPGQQVLQSLVVGAHGVRTLVRIL